MKQNAADDLIRWMLDSLHVNESVAVPGKEYKWVPKGFYHNPCKWPDLYNFTSHADQVFIKKLDKMAARLRVDVVYLWIESKTKSLGRYCPLGWKNIKGDVPLIKLFCFNTRTYAHELAHHINHQIPVYPQWWPRRWRKKNTILQGSDCELIAEFASAVFMCSLYGKDEDIWENSRQYMAHYSEDVDIDIRRLMPRIRKVVKLGIEALNE